MKRCDAFSPKANSRYSRPTKSDEEHADSPAVKRHGTEGFDRRIQHAFHNRDDAERQPTGIVDFVARPEGRGLDLRDDQVVAF